MPEINKIDDLTEKVNKIWEDSQKEFDKLFDNIIKRDKEIEKEIEDDVRHRSKQ